MVSVLTKKLEVQGNKVSIEVSLNGSLHIEARIPNDMTLNDPLHLKIVMKDRDGDEVTWEPITLSIWFEEIATFMWDELDLELSTPFDHDLSECKFDIVLD